MELIPYGKQYIDQSDIDAVVEVLKSDWLTQGPKIREFEELVAAYHHCSYAVAFSNGTAALHGAYFTSTQLAYGKGEKKAEDSEKWNFLTSNLTFAASANAGLYCDGEPKFVDIDRNTYCMDISQIEDVINDETRAITPVSYAGYPVDIKRIKELSKVKENHICIIHDACHAIGARRDGAGISDYADMTILSFHPVKHITTGEGGIVLTNDSEIYQKLLLFRNHGITKDPDDFIHFQEGLWYYEMHSLGYNYRITDIQCALGISQLKKLNQFLYKRNQIAEIYDNQLENLSWLTIPPGFKKETITPVSEWENLHSYHLYPVLLENSEKRKGFFEYLRNHRIGCQVHYRPVSKLEYYSNNYKIADALCANAQKFYESEISLPMFYSLTEEQQEYIIDIIIKWEK